MSSFDWEEFVNSYYTGIYRYCYHFLGSEADAEDATQKAFFKAWRSFSSLKDRAAAKAWIYRITRNVCLDQKRWWKRYSAALEESTRAAVEHETNEMMLTLQKLILELPQKQREVFILRHWHDFSTAETAKLLGIHEGTVKSHLKRAVEALKENLRAGDRETETTDSADPASIQ